MADTATSTGADTDTDTETSDAEAEQVAAAEALFAARKRRLDVIRMTVIVAAGAGIASVFAPWWYTQIPPSTMRLPVDGQLQVIELGWAEAFTTGYEGGELTRTVILAAIAVGVWYAMGRLWWWAAPAVLWLANPTVALGPPNTPPASRVGERSHLVDLTHDMWGLTLNRVAFYALCALVIVGGIQAWRTRGAQKALMRAEGEPTGLWETKILPRLAQAGVSIDFSGPAKDNKENTAKNTK